MVKSDNDRHQQEMDQKGNAGDRSLNVRIYAIPISPYRISDLFAWDSSLTPTSPIQNMS